ncbi:STAS/SEC14 domain-containing protein [Pseudoalteromonas sp. A25]|uniref:STAS/SEC14 domain-containing protein n=1 Tax=Pseudoalteromonas sp. A25 TaxID=116092 RepID=UPI0012608B8F|nr:STAS/SEC14 domain-containing protein [Pseudoalteromonas sp. A25]BBN83314.1 STAS/SEC14 domain-containing protein [Pseudoalteromonas sp. A25]
MSQHHGFSIGIERLNDQFIVHMKAFGTLTHEDYKTITPMLEGAFQQVAHPHIKVLADMTHLEGWELQAAWDDLKLGLKYGSSFDKVALIGSHPWQDTLAKIAGWFIGAQVEKFTDQAQAQAWLLKKE